MKKFVKEYRSVGLFYLLIILTIFSISINNNSLNTRSKNNVSNVSVLNKR